MIYIAGKITGEDFTTAWNKFQVAEAKLHAMGVQVINPMKLGIPLTWTWQQQLDKCIEVFKQNATCIFLLRDWRESEGAKREFLTAMEINNVQNNRISIYYEESNGYAEVSTDVDDKILTCLTPIQ